MTKKIIGLGLIITTAFINKSCTSFFQKEVKVLLNKGYYGWYFVYIENDGISAFDYKNNHLSLCDSNFVQIKMDDPFKYKLRVYDCKTGKHLSNKMKMYSYSGSMKDKMCYEFYYPDPDIYSDEIFDVLLKTKPTIDEEELYWEMRDKLDAERNSLFESYIKKYNIQWWVHADSSSGTWKKDTMAHPRSR